MKIQLILFTVLLIIFIIWNAYIIIIQKKEVNHAVQQIIRTCMWGILALLLQEDWRDKLMYFAAYHFAFGLPFDWSLNKLRKLPLLYIGSTAWSDKLGLKWPSAFWGLKVILFLIGMGTLIFGTYF